MRARLFPATLAVFLTLAFVAIAGCQGGGDDDDDDKPRSYGQDIEGLYPARMTIESDGCQPDNEGEFEDWIIEIEQSGDLRVGWVRYQKAGQGGEKVELFQGETFGTTIVKLELVTSPLTGADCAKFEGQNYSVRVDEETGTIEGRLISDVFYEGAGCDSSSVDCYFERVIAPAETGGD
ncbi:hypothetical protein K8I61_00965 [bacterium]|nr:hypothetical protein [bacterium]